MSTPIWAALDPTTKRLYVIDPGVERPCRGPHPYTSLARADLTGIGQPQHPLHKTGVQLPQYFWPQGPQD